MLKKIILLFLISFLGQSNLFSMESLFIGEPKHLRSPFIYINDIANPKCVHCDSKLIHPCKYLESVGWVRRNDNGAIEEFIGFECSNEKCLQAYLFKTRTWGDNISDSTNKMSANNNN